MSEEHFDTARRKKNFLNSADGLVHGMYQLFYSTLHNTVPQVLWMPRWTGPWDGTAVLHTSGPLDAQMDWSMGWNNLKQNPSYSRDSQPKGLHTALDSYSTFITEEIYTAYWGICQNKN